VASAFGGQRSIQLSYGRVGAPLSRIPLGGERPRVQTWPPYVAAEIGWLDEGLPMRPQCPTFAALRGSALRGFAYLRLVAAALFGFLAGCPPVAADELVKFVSAGRGEPIQGYLTRSRGTGPFPAVVLLHTCLGLPEARASLGERIAAWGYVALFVDDFATRGLKETCAVDFSQALPDAYGAFAYLSRLPYVDSARIAAVGFSQGGDTALKIATGGGRSAGDQGAVFKAAAAFYPPCANVAGAALDIPTLILVGAKDGVTPAADCAELAKRQQPSMVKFVVYSGAAHGFDIPEFGEGTKVMGMWLAYDRSAAQRSWTELRSFLAARLAR
jgi:dienelactone hydrolase